MDTSLSKPDAEIMTNRGPSGGDHVAGHVVEGRCGQGLEQAPPQEILAARPVLGQTGHVKRDKVSQKQLDHGPYAERHILYFLQRVFALLAGGFGLTVLLGWITGVPSLTTFGTGKIPMAPSSALLLLLYGAAVFFHDHMQQRPGAYLTGLVFGWSVTAISLLLLILSSLGIYLTVEYLGMHIVGELNGLPVGHISPVTAFCFVLTGFSFLSLLSSSSERQLRSVAAFALAALVVWSSIALVLAYVFGAPVLYGTTIIPPSLTSSIGFLILATSLLISSGQHIWSRDAHSHAADRRSTYILVVTFVMLAASIITAGYFYIRHFERNYRTEIENQLSAIAAMKTEGLEDWREDYLRDAAVLFNNASFHAVAGRYLNNPGDAESGRVLQQWLELYPDGYHFDQVRLIDTQGETRMSVPAGRPPTSLAIRQEIPDVLRSAQVKLKDFYFCDECKKVHLGMLIPILDETNVDRPLGVLVLRIDPTAYLYPYIHQWPVPSRTADAMLVRREGNDVLCLNDLKFQENAALKLRFSLDENRDVVAVKAALGQTGIVEGMDYRGAPEVAAVRAVSNSPWFLVAGMDISEVHAPVRGRIWMMFGIVGILVLSAGAVMGLAWQGRRMQFYREKQETEDALQESRALMQSIADNTTDAIYVKDLQGRYLFLNAAAEKVVGKSAMEVLGKDDNALSPSSKAAVAVVGDCKAVEERSTKTYEEVVSDAAGSTVTYLSTKGPVCDSSGKTIGQFGIARDITARKRAETEREKIVIWQQGVTLLQQSLLAPAPLDQKIKQITDGVVQLLEADFCRIWLIQPGDLCEQGCIHAEVHEGPHACRHPHRCLHLRASSGRYAHTDGKDHRRIPIGSYKIGLIASGQDHKILTNDAQNDPDVQNHKWARDLGLVSFAGYQLRAPDGETLGVLGLFSKRSISPALDALLDALSTTVAFVVQQAKAEIALQRSETKFRLLYDSTSDAVMLANERGFIDCNNAALSIFGCTTREQFCSLHPADVSPPEQPCGTDSRTLANERIAVTMAKGSNHFEWVHKRIDTGESFYADVLLSALELDGKGLVQGVVRDITERRLAQEELAQTTSRYTTMINTVPAVMYVKNTDHQYITANLELSRLANRPIDDILGLTTQEIFTGEFATKLYDADEAAMVSNQEKTVAEENLEFPDGEERWVSTTRVPLQDQQGHVTGVVGLLQDVTNQRRSREQLAQADKLAAIGTLAAGVAHEINNPIGFISSNLTTMSKYIQKLRSILDKPTGVVSEDRDILTTMLTDFGDAISESLEGTTRVRNIVADLKSFSRVDRAEKELANLNEGINSTLNIVWNELKYKCKVEKDLGDIPDLFCIPNQLNQVFMNTLINAGHAIKGDEGLIKIRTWADDDNISVSVEDNGVGIPPQNMKKIFEPFFTTKEVGKGTGLGLSLAYDIVKKHRGHIDVWSEVGVGTRFTIVLPKDGLHE